MAAMYDGYPSVNRGVTPLLNRCKESLAMDVFVRISDCGRYVALGDLSLSRGPYAP